MSVVFLWKRFIKASLLRLKQVASIFVMDALQVTQEDDGWMDGWIDIPFVWMKRK